MDQWGCTVMTMPAVILVKLHSEGDTDSEEGRRRDLDGPELIHREGWHPQRVRETQTVTPYMNGGATTRGVLKRMRFFLTRTLQCMSTITVNLLLGSMFFY